MKRCRLRPERQSRFNYDYPNTPSTGYTTATSRVRLPQWCSFTAADSPLPAMGIGGNKGANRFRGPGFAETNFALLKNDQINERFGFQSRFEFYSLFNRANLNGWTATCRIQPSVDPFLNTIHGGPSSESS